MNIARLRMSAAYLLRDFPDGGEVRHAQVTPEGDVELVIAHPTIPDLALPDGATPPLAAPRFSASGFEWGLPGEGRAR